GMQHPDDMHVVQFEALHLRPVDERRMRRRQLLRSAPDRAGLCGIKLTKPPLQYAAPLEMRAIQTAAQRIEYQQLDAGRDLRRDGLVAQGGNELRDATCVSVVAGCLMRHGASSRR